METMLSRLGLRPLISRRRSHARRRRNAQLLWPASFVLGSAAMYYLDPARGSARRALVRSQSVRAIHLGEAFGRKGVRDLRHRARGIFARIAGFFRPETEAPDGLLQARVRSKLGHVVSDQRNLHVVVDGGCVTLRGTVPADDFKPLVGAVRSTPGVTAVDVKLTISDEALVPHAEKREKTWSPGIRLLIGGVGVVFLAAGFERRGLARRVLSAVGAMILVRDFTNTPVRTLAARGIGRGAIELQKTITIHAPIETVFAYWAVPDNFPKIMSHVASITRLGDRTYRWTEAAKAGLSVSWHAEVTDFVRNESVAWRSLPGESVATEGKVRFESTPDGSTRVDVKMSYAPVGGVIGHAIASVFGADPKHVIDEDMIRSSRCSKTARRAFTDT